MGCGGSRPDSDDEVSSESVETGPEESSNDRAQTDDQLRQEMNHDENAAGRSKLKWVWICLAVIIFGNLFRFRWEALFPHCSTRTTSSSPSPYTASSSLSTWRHIDPLRADQRQSSSSSSDGYSLQDRSSSSSQQATSPSSSPQDEAGRHRSPYGGPLRSTRRTDTVLDRHDHAAPSSNPQPGSNATTVAKEKISQLPTKPSGLEDDEVCSICTETFDPSADLSLTRHRRHHHHHHHPPNEARYLECRHPFHIDCILQWIGRGEHTCPMCRTAIPQAQ